MCKAETNQGIPMIFELYQVKELKKSKKKLNVVICIQCTVLGAVIEKNKVAYNEHAISPKNQYALSDS